MKHVGWKMRKLTDEFLGHGVEWSSRQEQWGQEAKNVLKFELYRYRYGTVLENKRISGDGKLSSLAYSRY